MRRLNATLARLRYCAAYCGGFFVHRADCWYSDVQIKRRYFQSD